MEGFQCVAKVEEIPPGQVKVEGGPLNKGRVKGHVVSCPWHDLAFDVRNGQGTDGGGYCVGSYDVRVEDGQVFVGGRRKV